MDLADKQNLSNLLNPVQSRPVPNYFGSSDIFTNSFISAYPNADPDWQRKLTMSFQNQFKSIETIIRSKCLTAVCVVVFYFFTHIGG